jgi:uncharacterized protein
MNYTITQLSIYPVKSLPGINLQQAELDSTGLKYDRRWMLVDSHGRFISQREIPELCLFQTNLLPNGFSISYQSQQIEIPFAVKTNSGMKVRIWDDEVVALKAPEPINEWFSIQLNKTVLLVYMPEQTQRWVDNTYAQQQETVSFADGFPLLLIGESSLHLLQSKLTEPITMNRFRPNIVFSGGVPHCEDDWNSFSINQLTFKAVKPCARCVMITINPLTGQLGAEPLRALSTYRKRDHKVLFGQNIIAPVKGQIAVGMSIQV